MGTGIILLRLGQVEDLAPLGDEEGANDEAERRGGDGHDAGANGAQDPHFDASTGPAEAAATSPQRLLIDAAFVEEKLGELAREKDVAAYIL